MQTLSQSADQSVRESEEQRAKSLKEIVGGVRGRRSSKERTLDHCARTSSLPAIRPVRHTVTWGIAFKFKFALFALSGIVSPLTSSSSLRNIASMSYLPKTPSHRHRSRSEAKTPLTPSLASGINALNLGLPRQGSHSPTKGKADVSFNPFLSSRPSSPVRRAQSTSRPASPIKRATTGSLQVSDSLQRQASSGVIRKGGVESRIDVITRDYVPPKTHKRSRSQPNVSGLLDCLFHSARRAHRMCCVCGRPCPSPDVGEPCPNIRFALQLAEREEQRFRPCERPRRGASPLPRPSALSHVGVASSIYASAEEVQAGDRTSHFGMPSQPAAPSSCV